MIIKKRQRIDCGVTQSNRDRNATRTLNWQRLIKTSLKDKDGYDEY